jgi:hypothetical protein
MAKHQLALDIPDTLNTCILRVVDMSIYDSSIIPECLTLNITVPGFTESFVIVPESIDFAKNITACDLTIQTSNCETTRNSIPDGVYVIKYSIAPNDIVYVEYNHLRITQALNKINNLLCCLDLPVSEPQGLIKDKLKEIQLLSIMLKAAKSKVEYCHNPAQGMDMYNYVIKRLTKLSCGCGCETC